MTTLEDPIKFTPRGMMPLKFDDLSDLSIWLNGEVQAWSDWADSQQLELFLRHRRGEFLTEIRNIKTVCDQIRNNDADINGPRMGELRNSVKKYETGPLIASMSPLGIDLLERGAQEPNEVVAEAIYGVNGNRFNVVSDRYNDANIRFVIMGIIKQFYAENGVILRESASLCSFQEQLKRISDEYDVRTSIFESKMEELERQRSIIDKKIQDGQSKKIRLFNIAIKKIEEGSRKFRELERLFNEHMKLEAPSIYWSKRASKGLFMAAVSFGAFATLAVATAWSMLRYNEEIKHILFNNSDKIELGSLLLISPVVVLFLWMFRMIARIFSLSTAELVESSQRAVMATTYLALLEKGGSEPNSAERILVLQALFRSSGSKDEPESLPANLLEAVTKAAQGKGG